MRKKGLLFAVLFMLLAGMTGCGSAQDEIEADMSEDISEDISEKGDPETEADAADAPTSEDDSSDTSGTRIQDQTFQTDLGEWGNVTFAAYAPENSSFAADGMNPDVRFYLMEDGQVLYEFPGWNEEHTNPDLFLAVSAVAFKDYNEDGLDDVITICEYETMSGEGYQLARIYFQLENKQGFEEDQLLTEYLLKNRLTDNVAAIMDAKEDYWDYLASMDGQRSTYSQTRVIAENRDMWAGDPDYADDLYQYAVADLDHNGRYEVVVSNMGGTGMYTYSRFYEINENYDGLAECETDFVEGDSQPDLMTGSMGGSEAPTNTASLLKTYMNEQGEFYYAVYDTMKNGAAEYYENVRSLTLQDGKILTTPIAYRTTIYNGETPSVTCTDASGNSISEEDYENAADEYFAGWQESETWLGWQDMNDLGNNAEEIAAQLDQSLNVFLY